MAFGLVKSRAAAPPELADDVLANKLLDAVIQELLEDRPRKDIVRDLVRNGWNRAAAGQFSDLAHQIARERKMAPDMRANLARKGSERMQASYGWIGSGVVMGILMTFAIENLKEYRLLCLLPIAYGVVEYISGYVLWYPHQQFWTPADAAKSKGDG